MYTYVFILYYIILYVLCRARQAIPTKTIKTHPTHCVKPSKPTVKPSNPTPHRVSQAMNEQEVCSSLHGLAKMEARWV
jgi:hypothetical protein